MICLETLTSVHNKDCSEMIAGRGRDVDLGFYISQIWVVVDCLSKSGHPSSRVWTNPAPPPPLMIPQTYF